MRWAHREAAQPHRRRACHRELRDRTGLDRGFRRPSPATLVAAVEATGYGGDVAHPRPPAEQTYLLTRLVVSAALSLPVLVLSMVSTLQFAGWPWLALALTTPVVLWGAWPFHRATATNLRHGAATMDTLISVGVLAAYAWSTWELLAGSSHHLYLEVAAVVTTFVLAGRFLEARAKTQSGAALRALLDMGAKDVAVMRDDVEIPHSHRRTRGRRRVRGAPGREGGHRRRRHQRRVRGRRRRC